MKKCDVSSITIEDIKKVYFDDESATMESAAKKLGCSRNTLTKIFKRFGLKSKDRTRNWHRVSKYPQLSDIEWLKEQLKTKSIAQIARELGTTFGNVGDRVRRYGLSDVKDKSEAVKNGLKKVKRNNSKRRKKKIIKMSKEERSLAIKNGLKKRFPNGRFREMASNWKGGRRMTESGYVYIYKPDHPNATKDGYVMEHRLVAEEKLGRPLHKDEDVHHINGLKDDNRPENLLVCSRKEHAKIHFEAVRKLYLAEQKIKELKEEVKKLKEEIKKLKS